MACKRCAGLSYTRIKDHGAMVFDGSRNGAYARALAKTVGPETSVMDLGAGLGVHGFMASRLGAGAVHLVEPSPVLSLAEEIARANSLQNIYYHQCTVQELQLAAPVDVIVSVFTGNFLLSEDLLPALFFARDKFLGPGGRLLPDRGRMEVVPVSAPDYYHQQVGRWAAYPEYAAAISLPALDYAKARRFAANALYYDAWDAFDATALGDPVGLTELDFATAVNASCDSEVQVQVEHAGACHGWLGWFQIKLADEWFSTSGEAATTHWRPVFLPLEQPLSVEVGDTLEFSLKRPEFGEWSWITRHGATRQQQSTFLSQPISPEQLRRSSDHFQPNLSGRGEAACWLLQNMAGKATVSQLASQVIARFAGIFLNYEEALDFVKDLARRHG